MQIGYPTGFNTTHTWNDHSIDFYAGIKILIDGVWQDAYFSAADEATMQTAHAFASLYHDNHDDIWGWCTNPFGSVLDLTPLARDSSTMVWTEYSVGNHIMTYVGSTPYVYTVEPTENVNKVVTAIQSDNFDLVVRSE